MFTFDVIFAVASFKSNILPDVFYLCYLFFVAVVVSGSTPNPHFFAQFFFFTFNCFFKKIPMYLTYGVI